MTACVAASKASASSVGSAPCSRKTSRSISLCINPIVIPRPSDGSVHWWASPSATRAVATGMPSTTTRRARLAMPFIEAMSRIGSPSTQWAWSGQARTTRSNTSGWRTGRSARSSAQVYTVTDHVARSAGRVSTEIEPIGVMIGARSSSNSPFRER